MSFDLKRTWAQVRLARELAAGTVVEQEGLLLSRVLEDGKEKAAVVASPDGDTEVLGYSITADSIADRTSEVEEVVVPSSGPSNELEADLRNSNLVSGRLRVEVNGVALTVNETFAGPAAGGAVKVDLAKGILKFHDDEAGEAAKVTYLYDLTLQLAKQRFGERHINNRGLHEIHGAIELGSGLVELYTDQFDASVDYASATDLRIGAGGIITTSGSGAILNLKVVNVPNVNNPFLGVRGTLGE